MSTTISRMQFLRGDFSGHGAPLRPPWALDEETFTRLCTRCNDCIETCPTGLLKKGRGGFPQLEFSHGECLFCGDCATSCKPGALKKNSGAPPWTLFAAIDPDVCIAWKGVECRSCFDPCEAHAIQLSPQLGGVSIPTIEIELCSGCGACFAVCPVSAVGIQPAQAEE